MLTTLIYQSQINAVCSDQDLLKLSQLASEKNISINVTGILLFNGTEFCQVLEGEEDAIDNLFSHISCDARHTHVVEVIRDYSAHRRFNDIGMTLLDLQKIDADTLMQKIYQLSRLQNRNLADDRVFRLIKRFINQGGRYSSPHCYTSPRWKMVSNKSPRQANTFEEGEKNSCIFAFQPIVAPADRYVSSFEALIRDPLGRSPEHIFSAIDPDLLYEFDLKTKFIALQQAGRLLKSTEKISINLLPGSLYAIPDSVPLLLEYIKQANLRPGQVIIEILETELITKINEFHTILKEIRVAGIGLAIDDFGSGYSRLSLLATFQPDKIKVDRSLIKDIHKNFAQQAMIASIVQYCEDMAITLIAEGVESVEEWFWLQSIGVRLFQGFLFAKPCLDGIGEIYWPEKQLSDLG